MLPVVHGFAPVYGHLQALALLNDLRVSGPYPILVYVGDGDIGAVPHADGRVLCVR